MSEPAMAIRRAVSALSAPFGTTIPAKGKGNEVKSRVSFAMNFAWSDLHGGSSEVNTSKLVV